MGDEGLERISSRPRKTTKSVKQCAPFCANSEIPMDVAESGLLAVWDQLPEEVRVQLATLTLEMIAALQVLFRGLPSKP